MRGSDGFMNLKRLLLLAVCFILFVTAIACDPVDEDYGVVSESKQTETVEEEPLNNADTAIRSLDRVMSNYFDISLFDEENYSNIYLGKRFKIDAQYNGESIKIPAKLKEFEENGWVLAEGNTYNANSLVFAYESVDVVFVNAVGKQIKAQMFNSTRYSNTLSDCYIVKVSLDNNYFTSPENYDSFNVNGITNGIAITDIIQILGTPSHFYAVSDNCYYLDYFITKKDRRNGITIYINPIDDLITKIEFSYYK